MPKEYKAMKINNAAWLPEIAEHIYAFCRKAHVDGIQPGNLQTYFAQVAQGWFGKDACEFWMVFDNEKPVAFACWQVNGLPHIAKVSCFGIHSWAKDKGQATDMIVDEWVKFGERWNARWWSADFVSRATMRLFESRMKKRGFSAGKESDLVNIVFERR